MRETLTNTTCTLSRASVFSTASQPKALAATSDNTTFVVGADAVEAVRNNQKVADFRPGVNPTIIATAGSLLAIGFGVRNQKKSSPLMPGCLLTPHLFFFGLKDQKVRLYDWDGKALQEVGLLEANKGLVSALAFSPDGLKLAAGDVSKFTVLLPCLTEKTCYIVYVRARWLTYS